VTKRFALILVALATTTSLVLAACSQTPTAPALTDPKEILAQTILSLKDVKSVELTGSLTGKLEAAELGGSLDLSSTKISGAIDVTNQKAKFSVDAPSIMGTKVEALLVGGFAYVKMEGMFAGMLGLTPGKYMKEEVPTSSGEPMTNPAEIAKQIDEFKKGLDKLPTPPTKAADEKCGDQDCYHVTIKITAAELAALGEEVEDFDGDMSFDVWSRKNDVRPAKLALSMTSSQFGTIGMSFDFKYDITVNVDAPPADQIAE
jgi:hypothetical protein